MLFGVAAHSGCHPTSATPQPGLVPLGWAGAAAGRPWSRLKEGIKAAGLKTGAMQRLKGADVGKLLLGRRMSGSHALSIICTDHVSPGT